MTSALERLVIFNSIPKSVRRIFELFNTHPSIYRRVNFVNRSINGNASVTRYQNYLLEAKILVVLLPIFSAAIILLFL